MQNLRASFAAYWESIQQGLFPRLEQVLGSLTEKQQQLVPLLSHIFSATAVSEGLGNPVARAS